MAKFALNEKQKEVSVSIGLKECPLESVRFTAHLFSDRADPLIEPLGKGYRVTLRYRDKLPRKRLQTEGKRFIEELDAQRFQGELLDNNEAIRKFIVEQALSGEAAPREREAEDSLELSDEEEKELDRLISEVEDLIAKESEGKPPGKKNDPLGIGSTWEEKHGKK